MMTSPALVVVDVQNKYASGDLEGPARSILPTVNGAISAFRAAGRPIFFIRMEGSSPCVPEVEGGDDFLAGLDVREGDTVVTKRRMNAFHGTGLGDAARSAGCDSVVVCGLVSRWCVHATYFGAYDEDLTPFVLRGGIAGTDPENTRMVEALCKTVGVDELP